MMEDGEEGRFGFLPVKTWTIFQGTYIHIPLFITPVITFSCSNTCSIFHLSRSDFRSFQKYNPKELVCFFFVLELIPLGYEFTLPWIMETLFVGTYWPCKLNLLSICVFLPLSHLNFSSGGWLDCGEKLIVHARLVQDTFGPSIAQFGKKYVKQISVITKLVGDYPLSFITLCFLIDSFGCSISQTVVNSITYSCYFIENSSFKFSINLFSVSNRSII